MQPPPFYSEFRLDRREYTCICMCARILAMHTCPCACIPVSVSTRFSLRREFVTASRLFAVSPSHFIPLVSAYPASLSSFLRQVYRDPILLSLFLSLSLSTYCYPGMHRKSHRCTCTRCTSSYTCWTNSPLGHPSDEPSRKRGETRTHT